MNVIDKHKIRNVEDEFGRKLYSVRNLTGYFTME